MTIREIMRSAPVISMLILEEEMDSGPRRRLLRRRALLPDRRDQAGERWQLARARGRALRRLKQVRETGRQSGGDRRTLPLSRCASGLTAEARTEAEYRPATPS